MCEVLIRDGIVADAGDVYRLLCIIADLHRNGRPDMFPGLVSKYTIPQLEERLAKENHGIIVAELDGSVVGYVFCDIIKEGNGLTVYVDDLCVEPKARGKGIGCALMDKAAEYGKNNGCCQLMLNVWEFNSSAVKFYEKYGLKTRTRHMEMKL